jgi:hypothetical protein
MKDLGKTINGGCMITALAISILLVVMMATIKAGQAKSLLTPSQEQEFEIWPDTMACDCCGHPMTYVSEDLGYTCTNSQCIAHIGEVVTA